MTEFIITEDFPKSQVEFDKRFSTERACYEYLFKLKWPDGFSCVKCGHPAYWVSSKYIYICTRCEHQQSLTAGTIMHSTKNQSPIGSRQCGGLQPENQVLTPSI